MLKQIENHLSQMREKNYKSFRRTSRMKVSKVPYTFKVVYRNTPDYDTYRKIVDYYEVYNQNGELVDLTNSPMEFINSL